MAQTARQRVGEASTGLTVVVAGGLIGVPRLRRFVLERGTDATAPFHLLVSLDGTGSCLVVCDAEALWPDYAAEARRAAGAAERAAVLTIVTARPGALTTNLVAPLVVDPDSGAARQLVLEDARWATRHPL
jgi:flagellar assembly factor FliW